MERRWAGPLHPPAQSPGVKTRNFSAPLPCSQIRSLRGRGEQGPCREHAGCQSWLLPVDDAGTVPAGPAVGDVLPCPVGVSPVTEQKCCEPGDPALVCLCLPSRTQAPHLHLEFILQQPGAGTQLESHPLLPGIQLLSSLGPSSCPPCNPAPLLPGSQRLSSQEMLFDARPSAVPRSSADFSDGYKPETGTEAAPNPSHLLSSPSQSCTSRLQPPQATMHLPTHGATEGVRPWAV